MVEWWKMEYWNDGMLEYWNDGMLEDWNGGMMEEWKSTLIPVTPVKTGVHPHLFKLDSRPPIRVGGRFHGNDGKKTSQREGRLLSLGGYYTAVIYGSFVER